MAEKLIGFRTSWGWVAEAGVLGIAEVGYNHMIHQYYAIKTGGVICAIKESEVVMRILTDEAPDEPKD